MAQWRSFSGVGFLATSLAVSCFAQEKPTTPVLTGAIGSFHSTGADREISGYCNAAAQWLPDGNAVCYAITKSPKEKEKYLYFMVIKTGKALPGGGVRMEGESKGVENIKDDRWELELLDKARRVKIAYRFKTDAKTNAVLSEESLAIGDLTLKPEDPHVVLVDLTGEKPSYKAVKVAFPDAVPELADFEAKRADAEARARVLSQAFRELEKKSPEVKEFLATKTK
jgi:hypothetical protein